MVYTWNLKCYYRTNDKYVLSGWDKENEQNLATYIFHIDSYLSEMAKGQKSEEKQL